MPPMATEDAVRHPKRGLPAYLAEFVGTLLLVLFICSFLSLSAVKGLNLAALGLVHAFALFFLITTLGGTSGAHFNPAVTIALAALRKISPIGAAIYIVMQLAGGIGGAFLVKLLYLNEGRPPTVHYGATIPSHQFLQGGKLGLAVVAEFIGTFALMWAIMGTAVNPHGQKEWAGLVIGATLGLAVMIFGPLTGASFNPARSLGPALASGTYTDFWIYIVAPIAGALAAAFGYAALVLEPKDRFGLRPIDKLD
ncbi:MAG: aquaporin [Solirubrobacteraceae bacterium]|jgi:MIP family channel proteins|nr:aquaporin [Solirubrobacteraceae bacterium]